MKSYIVKVQKNGYITIPKEIREKLNIKPGDPYTMKHKNGTILVEFKHK